MQRKMCVLFSFLILLFVFSETTELNSEVNKTFTFSQNQEEKLGVTYQIELEGAGIVPPNHIFHTGDRIRILLKTNFLGYVYVISQGASGHTAILFPSKGGHYALNTDMEYAVPQRGWFQFAPPSGLEKVTVILSRSAIDPFSKVLTQPSPEIRLQQPHHQMQTTQPSITLIDVPELDSVIKELSSRALTRGRDLVFTEELPNNNQANFFPTSSFSQGELAFILVFTHSN